MKKKRTSNSILPETFDTLNLLVDSKNADSRSDAIDKVVKDWSESEKGIAILKRSKKDKKIIEKLWVK